MKTIEEVINDVLAQEGGYVNDPNDKGGPTKYGISLRYARGIGLDLNHDGETDLDDILLVTREEAIVLYFDDFYFGPRINRLPEPIQPQMVDIAVNSGPPRAIIMLQKTLNRCHGYELDEDGVMGPSTRRCAEEVCDGEWERLNNNLVDVRSAFYRNLAARDERQGKFLRGWLRRAESFRV